MTTDEFTEIVTLCGGTLESINKRFVTITSTGMVHFRMKNVPDVDVDDGEYLIEAYDDVYLYFKKRPTGSFGSTVEKEKDMAVVTIFPIEFIESIACIPLGTIPIH